MRQKQTSMADTHTRGEECPMTTSTHLDSQTQRIFEASWRKALALEIGRKEAERVPMDSVTAALAHRLIDLLMESHDQPFEHFEGVVRRLVIEQQYVGENGDESAESACPLGVDRQVRVLVLTIENVRGDLLNQGTWSEAPVTPLMFG